MAEAAKVIRIELRVGGGSKSSSGERKKREPKLDRFGLTRKQSLAGAGYITVAAQLVSKGFSIAETLSYNSEEKTNMMLLNISKTAVSSALVAGGYALGGPIGGAIGLAVNQFIAEPLFKGGEISIQRNLDQTRATNRFYQTNFAGKGNYVFDYSTSSYINEDLDKVRKGSFYKKGGAI